MDSVPTFREAARFWAVLGFINFGGPAGQIALMHRELVERRRWISEDRFLHALNFCMLLPGPEAQQLATYIGWRLHGVRGGFVAGLGFILPAFFLLLAFSFIYAVHGRLAPVAAVFGGLRAAVVALVAEAMMKVAGRALKRRGTALIAAAAFVAIFFLRVPFPAVVAGAAALGLLLARVGFGDWRAAGTTEAAGASVDRVPFRRTLAVVAVGLFAWWTPLLAVTALVGPSHVIAREAVFFSKAAMVTFGGAYAVLAYLDQAAVHVYGWLEAGQMLDGLALAETTPGPLIMVTEFVGFLAAYRHPGALHPVAAGVLGAAVTVWATFAPCFLWIFAGAPYVERLRGNRGLAAALSAITAAVVGVIGSLALTFALHTFFTAVRFVDRGPLVLPEIRLLDLDPIALLTAAACFVVLQQRLLGVFPVILIAGAIGLLRLP